LLKFLYVDGERHGRVAVEAVVALMLHPTVVHDLAIIVYGVVSTFGNVNLNDAIFPMPVPRTTMLDAPAWVETKCVWVELK
jgi:hypothetical protein